MIFFKRHVLQDRWGESDTGGTDETAYGGRYSGFDPNTPGIKDEYKGNFSGSGWSGPTLGVTPAPGTEGSGTLPTMPNLSPEAEGFLSKMFKSPDLGQMQGNLQDLTAMNPNQGAFGWFQPGSLGYRWGLRDPGSLAARDKNFFDNETEAERNDRMGLVGNTLGVLGNAFMATAMPPTLSSALGAIKGYQEYKDTGDVKRGLGTALTALPGYFGAAGNVLKGNYGSALTGALAKNGVAMPEASLAGLALDKYQGKSVTKPLMGLGGYFAGRSLGGPVGGVFGQNIGKSLANIYGKK